MRHGNHVLERKMADLFPELPGSDKNMKKKLGDRTIKQLLNSVIAKYRDLSVSRTSIICLGLRLRQIIDLLASDISRYFAQPRPIIVNYWKRFQLGTLLTKMFVSYFAVHRTCLKHRYVLQESISIPLFYTVNTF